MKNTCFIKMSKTIYMHKKVLNRASYNIMNTNWYLKLKQLHPGPLLEAIEKKCGSLIGGGGSKRGGGQKAAANTIKRSTSTASSTSASNKTSKISSPVTQGRRNNQQQQNNSISGSHNASSSSIVMDFNSDSFIQDSTVGTGIDFEPMLANLGEPRSRFNSSSSVTSNKSKHLKKVSDYYLEKS